MSHTQNRRDAHLEKVGYSQDIHLENIDLAFGERYCFVKLFVYLAILLLHTRFELTYTDMNGSTVKRGCRAGALKTRWNKLSPTFFSSIGLATISRETESIIYLEYEPAKIV